MKQYARSTLICCLTLICLSALCFAATIDQVAGDYTLIVEEKVAVKKIGKDTWSGQSTLTVNANGTWLDNLGASGVAVLDAKGKKLLLHMDGASIAELEDTLVDWAYAAAAQAGVSASGLKFTFTDLKAAKCKIDKKTNRLAKKFKVTGKGIASGTVDGDTGVLKFKYSLKATIL